MFALTLIVCAGLVLAGLVVLFRAVIGAPLGYESGLGFFEGAEPSTQGTMAPDDARSDRVADGAFQRMANKLGSRESAEPWIWEGSAAEPVLSTRGASSHVAHSVQ